MKQIQRITVVGAGAVGCATAALLTYKGFEVRLYNRSADRLHPIFQRGGIELLDGEAKGVHKLSQVTSDLGAAVKGTDLILIMTTSCGHRGIAKALGPLLEDGQTVLLCSGAAGTLEFAKIWVETGSAAEVLLGETSTMPLAARVRGDAQYTMKLPSTPRTAAFPGKRTTQLCQQLAPIFKTVPVAHVLDTGINNPNWLIHPIPMVLNFAEIERQDGMFSLMNAGMTDSVLRAMDAYDKERMRLQRMLGLSPLTVDEIYIGNGSGPWVYRDKGEPMGFKDKIHMRYLDEDIPYGSMFLASLGDLLGVDTPLIDAANVLAELLTEKDYWSEARTPARLGIAGMDLEHLLNYLKEGSRN